MYFRKIFGFRVDICMITENGTEKLPVYNLSSTSSQLIYKEVDLRAKILPRSKSVAVLDCITNCFTVLCAYYLVNYRCIYDHCHIEKSQPKERRSQVGSFLSRVIPKDFKKWYSQLPCLALSIKRDNVENKPASLLVVSLGKALNGMPPPLCGRQVAHPYFTGL